MKPHIFRLKLRRGSEKRALEDIICDLERKLQQKPTPQEEEADEPDSASYLDPSQQDEDEEINEAKVTPVDKGFQR